MFILLYPTIRPYQAIETLKAWTHNDPEVLVKFVVNTNEDMKILVKGIDFAKYTVLVHKSQKKGVTGPLYALTSSELEANENDICIVVSDDFFPVVPEWKDALKKEFSERSGFLLQNDGFQDRNEVVTLVICDFKSLKRINKTLYNPVYTHNFSDMELYDVIRDSRLLIERRPELKLFLHKHWCNGGRQFDEHDNYFTQKWKEDEEVYHSRKNLSWREKVSLLNACVVDIDSFYSPKYPESRLVLCEGYSTKNCYVIPKGEHRLNYLLSNVEYLQDFAGEYYDYICIRFDDGEVKIQGDVTVTKSSMIFSRKVLKYLSGYLETTSDNKVDLQLLSNRCGSKFKTFGLPPSTSSRMVVSPYKKLVCFSLWGSKEMYFKGAEENIKMFKDEFPEFRCRFYLDETLPLSVDDRLRKSSSDTEIVRVKREQTNSGMFWRFNASDDPYTTIFLSRDTDSRPIPREVWALRNWLASCYSFCIMRDHPYHNVPILGGLWSSRFDCVNGISQLYRNWTEQEVKGCDQDFLGKTIYPKIVNNSLIFDSVTFPSNSVRFCEREGREYVGDVFDENSEYATDYGKLLSSDKPQLPHQSDGRAIGKIITSLGFNRPRVLDLGCGYDVFSSELTKMNLVYEFCDCSKKIVSSMRRKFPFSNGYCANLNWEYPFKDRKYQIIIAHRVNYYLRDSSRFFDLIDKLLTPDGVLLLDSVIVNDTMKTTIFLDDGRKDFGHQVDKSSLEKELNVRFKEVSLTSKDTHRTQYICKKSQPQIQSPSKDLFIVISCINVSSNPLCYTNIRSVFTPKERFDQLVRGLESIDGADIFLCEESKISEEMEVHLRKKCTKFFDFSTDTEVSTQRDSPYKGPTELLVLYKLSMIEDLQKYRRVFKFGARYWMNNEFNIDNFSLTEYTFARTAVDNVITVLYSIPRSKYKEFFEGVYKIYQDIKDKPISIENELLKILTSGVKIVPRLCVEGHIAINGIFQKI